MSNFLTRAKALAYDTQELMRDMSDMRKALATDELESKQAHADWMNAKPDYAEQVPEPEPVSHEERKAELDRSFDHLSVALRAIERVIVNEYQSEGAEIELPEFLPATGGQG